ncbi:unnamed protein product [Pocillopora meandrina]|uniref:Uncharacterized protein n=1 Tax=Pocillopora meandrina TaxID=46732 RepID=A0AAU9Y670_9CNID|nr:unnamed protein product [Pocillopora meandrina]
MDRPQNSFELEFYLNPAALFMNGEANPPSEEVRVNPEDIKLTFFLCLVSLNPAVYMSMMSMMTKTPTKYPMIRTEMRQFPLDNGATSKEINNPFNGKVPQRVIIGILKTTAFNGQYNEDPLAFGKFGVEYIKQIVNGEEYPYETLELNTANGQKDLVGYHRFLDATGCLYRNAGNMVRFKDWGHGKNCTLFAFSNVANGRHDDPVLLPKNEGFINIHIKCAGQASQKTVIVYAEYEGIMEIDGIKGATTMEFVWLTTNQLNALADSDPELRKYFVSALACDELPESPERVKPRAYIVNTHPADKPGEHWIAVWTEHDSCEILDSYGLDLTTYEFLTPFIVWLNRWSYVPLIAGGKALGLGALGGAASFGAKKA